MKTIIPLEKIYQDIGYGTNNNVKCTTCVKIESDILPEWMNCLKHFCTQTPMPETHSILGLDLIEISYWSCLTMVGPQVDPGENLVKGV